MLIPRVLNIGAAEWPWWSRGRIPKITPFISKKFN